MKIGYLALFYLDLAMINAAHIPCNLLTSDAGTVCGCNATYCDNIPDLENLKPGQYQLYSTSQAHLGFWSRTGNFSNIDSTTDATITVNTNQTYQTILGFGGAFTDSTGINIARLSQAAQEQLLHSYFGEKGVQYSIGRVPIGGTDFSTRGYTYMDQEDETLEGFALQEEDIKYKIHFIHRALELRGSDKLKFYASAWSAPKWMKTVNALNGFGKVKSSFYGLWARYYLKFFDAYSQHSISFWGVTTQNEPVDGLVGIDISNNGFSTDEMKRWIKSALGPAIRNSSYKNMKIILHDDQRILIPVLRLFILSDVEVLSYADGIGVHWYTDKFVPSFLLNFAEFPEKDLFLLATEACSGYEHKVGLEKAVDLGSWIRAELYLNSIFQDLEHNFIGWVDWNMALNETGGPNWISNEVDSPIIVSNTLDEFYKQPMYYALGHFSKFVVTGSVRTNITVSGSNVRAIAFIRPDGKIAVVATNGSNDAKTVKVKILNSTETLTLEARSVNTLLYQR